MAPKADDLTAERAAQPVKAIVIHCPRCLVQHIDEGQWLLIKHHTHQCQSCGYEFDVGYYSVGVDLAKTARQEALREAMRAISKLFDENTSGTPEYYCALLDAGNALDRLDSEGA